MRSWRLALAPLLLLACSSQEPIEPEDNPGPLQAEPAFSRVDPEDVFCGVTCEPFSSRPCGAGIEVCDPTGVGWGACGGDDYKPGPSLCAKGTICRRRPSGDPAICAEACKGGEDTDCVECRRRFVFGGLMGCRAICEVTVPKKGAPGCEEDQELVKCKVATPTRAEGAGCLPGPEPLTYCCPPGSPIVNPPLFCGHPRKQGVPQDKVLLQLKEPERGMLLPLLDDFHRQAAGIFPGQNTRPRQDPGVCLRGVRLESAQIAVTDLVPDEQAS